MAIRALYEQREKVLEHYERWFSFAESKSQDHIVVAPHGGMKLYSIAEWRNLVSDSDASEPKALAG